jgi:hypothetical protein
MIRANVKISAILLAAALLYSPPSPVAIAQTKVPLLYVQTAKNVAFKDGVLTLQEVAPATVFFSERPKRLVGHVRNDLFLKQWTEGKNSFKSDPPNAVLSIFNETARPSGAVVVLSNPRLDGKNLLYDARILKGSLPATGPESTLFIDGNVSDGAPCENYDTGDPSNLPCWAQNAFDANN